MARRTGDEALGRAQKYLLLEAVLGCERRGAGQVPVEAELPVELHVDDRARVDVEVDAGLLEGEGSLRDGLIGREDRRLGAERDVGPARAERAKVSLSSAQRRESRPKTTHIVRAASVMTLRKACWTCWTSPA